MKLARLRYKTRAFFGMHWPSSTETYSPQQRKTALLMLLLTAAYLVVELAFNARLLDVVGSLEGGEAVEGIEKYGRLISGTAVALLVLGKILGNAAKKGKGPVGYFFSLFTIALFCGTAMVAVYVGQKKLVDTLVQNSSDENRRRAAVLVPMGKLIKTGVVGVPGLELTEADYETAAGKTFLATFPLQTMSHPSLFQSLEGNVQAIFQAFSEQERKYGDGFYGAYKESIVALKKQYDGPYSTASRQYQNALGPELMRHQNQAWRDYERKLQGQRRNLRPDNVPPAYWRQVRNDVRGMDVPVGDNWAPSDRTGFNAAIATRVRNEALRTFRDKSMQELKLSTPLDPVLEFDDFLRHAAIQGKWKASLRLEPKIPLRAGLESGPFQTEIYLPAVANDTATLMRKNYAPAAQYGPRGGYRKTGEDSYRALIVPPIALVFSLMGAMTHIFKVLMFARKIFAYVAAPVYWGAFVLYLALVAAIPLAFTNHVTEQPLFEKLEAYTRDGLGGANGLLVAKGIRWVTQFQPYFNPVNEWVRTRVLDSPTFERKIEFLENADR